MIIKPQEESSCWDKVLLSTIMVVCGLIIAFCFVIELCFQPQQVAERRLAKLANEYYQVYLYPQLAESSEDIEETFSRFLDAGIPTTYLRQLLLYNNGEHQDDLTIFQNRHLYCDTNSTGVRFYPKPPYGPDDYTVQYIWQCDSL